MTFVLPLPPGVNHYWISARGRVFLSKEGRLYKRDAAVHARRFGLREPFAGPLAVTMKVFRRRRAGDIDGYFKATFDALNGIAWKDDSQIVEVHAFRRDDPERPRVELEVTPLAEQEALPIRPRQDPADAIR